MATVQVDQANAQHGIQSCPVQYDPLFDYTQCINDCAAAAGAGGTVQFTRGNEYKLTGPVYTSGGPAHLSDGVTFEDTGTGALPVLYTESAIHGGMLLVRGDDVTIQGLYLRGPWADMTAAPGRTWQIGHYGVHVFERAGNPDDPPSMVWCDNFTLLSTMINGFGANGLKLTGGSGHQVLNNTLAYNFETGIAVFGATGDMISATDIKVSGNSLQYNGANGLDTCADHSEYTDNTAIENGWAHAMFPVAGEGQGFIFNPCGRKCQEIIIDGNTIIRSARSGLIFLDDGLGSFDTIDIRNNYFNENGTTSAVDNGWGVRFDGTMQNTELEHNDASMNYSGCYNVPYSGVTVGDNCCDGLGGPGPHGAPCLL